VASSNDVRDFYEKLPYPPPLTSLDEHRELSSNPQRRRALFHRIWPTEQPGASQEVLIAGCGTSQAARHALSEPNARVTAIDISETSLRHTADLKRQYGLDNLELQELPIERVQKLGRSFDLIVCTGVLHHLPDPDLGLRVLREALKPRGAMHLMVYATYGRTGIYMMQEYCRLLGIGTTDRDLRDLAVALGALPANHPLAELLRRAKDFRRPEAMADALLHPLDRAYTVPEMYAWLERSGLCFGRWIEQAPYLPHCGVLANTTHAARMASLSEPNQHAAAELFRGTMTRHRFIAYGSPQVATERRVRFSGEQWRSYVPIRLPWTLCIRERVPAGSVAVLLNPTHEYSDLILPINSAEDRLLEQIDGVRTLGEIVSGAEANQSARALQFFERLWQYDQIVFDASRAVAATL
jgi:SAM-dependent methyltransferase